MQSKLRICLFLGVMSILLMACHQSPEKVSSEQQDENFLKDPDIKKVYSILQKKHPDTISRIYTINRINKLDSKVDLFEVVTPEAIFYTNRTVDYIAVGSLLIGDQNHSVNITALPETQKQFQRAREKIQPLPALSQKVEDSSAPPQNEMTNIFNSLPLKSGFTYVYGTGENKIAVFEDPDCPFCQKFHKDLETMGPELNISVTVFPFVLESIHPHALDRVKNIFCTNNPTQSWQNWMLFAEKNRELGKNNMDVLWKKWSSVNAPISDCPQAVLVDTWQKVGHTLDFVATPTIVFSNGEILEKAPDSSILKQMFSDIQLNKSAE